MTASRQEEPFPPRRLSAREGSNLAVRGGPVNVDDVWFRRLTKGPPEIRGIAPAETQKPRRARSQAGSCDHLYLLSKRDASTARPSRPVDLESKGVRLLLFLRRSPRPLFDG